jgi:hypothetical protein
LTAAKSITLYFRVIMTGLLQAYALALRESERVVQDGPATLARRWKELELQALWYSGAFGRAFRSTEGSLIEVLQFGFWNREAGPDFVQAAIRIDGGEVLTGDIELDLNALDWEQHGHAENPAYNEVVLHVFVHRSAAVFYSRTAQHRQVAQVLLPPASHEPEPGEQGRHPGSCQAPLKTLSDRSLEELLEAAALVRVRRKAEQLKASIRVHGTDEALFQAIAVALGYKANKIPFLIVAQRARLEYLRREKTSVDALLFGLAGFLEDRALISELPSSAKEYVNELWSTWWRFRGALHPLILPPGQWRFTSTRPQNHPHRRLGALAAMVSRWSELRLLPPKLSVVEEWLSRLAHPFWTQHYSLRAKAPGPVQLLGSTRIRELLANIFFPMFFAEHPDAWTEFKSLRSELGNKQLERVCGRLFADPGRACLFSRFVYQQQGLLQIFEDFCLTHAAGCDHCPFPRLLERFEVQ